MAGKYVGVEDVEGYWGRGFDTKTLHRAACRTNEAGEFHIENVPAGVFRLRASHKRRGLILLGDVEIREGRTSFVDVSW